METVSTPNSMPREWYLSYDAAELANELFYLLVGGSGEDGVKVVE